LPTLTWNGDNANEELLVEAGGAKGNNGQPHRRRKKDKMSKLPERLVQGWIKKKGRISANRRTRRVYAFGKKSKNDLISRERTFRTSKKVKRNG